MHPLIYDVAVSADGFIAGPNGDVSRFPQGGPVVTDYLDRLATYGTAIMGRTTYEFGYDFCMAPGANPYPHMDCHVISDGLTLPGIDVTISPRAEAGRLIRDLKARATRPVYLCGGALFAGWALTEGLIDEVRLKRAPILLGGGTPLFSGITTLPDFTLDTTRAYDGGGLFQTFRRG